MKSGFFYSLVESSEKALDDFLEKLCAEINELVTVVENQEQEVRNDIEQYGRIFGESPLLVLSGLKAWRMIVESFTRSSIEGSEHTD